MSRDFCWLVEAEWTGLEGLKGVGEWVGRGKRVNNKGGGRSLIRRVAAAC